MALLSLAGVPPLSLWASKDAVLAAALHHSVPLYVAALVGVALSAAYAGTALRVLWAPADDEERRVALTHRGEDEAATGVIARTLTAVVCVLAGAAVLAGVVAVPAVARTLASTVGGAFIAPTPLDTAVSAVIALGVVLGVWFRPLPQPRWAVSWLGLEAAAHAVAVRPTLALAHRLARADDGLARGLDATATATVALARGLARIDDRLVDGAVRSVADGVRRVAASARRPQTGLLHQYYVQAVALVALGAALVLLVR